MELLNSSIIDLHNKLISKEIKAVELLSYFYNIIKKIDSSVNAFVTLTEEEAYKTAKIVDEKISLNQDIHLLSGIPIAVKDNIVTKNIRTTCSSRILENYIPPYDAFIIEKLKSLNVPIVGKTNMDEFAMGSSTETSYFKKTKNPFDLSRTPGGSSGGSASAVSARLVPASIGSDTGGSIRQPASFCGITGLKPTYGLVSRYGLIAFASSLDQIGTFGKSAEDSAIVLQAIAGKDVKDSTSVSVDIKDYISSISKDIKGMKIGVPTNFFDPLSSEYKKILNDSIQLFKNAGAEVKDIQLNLNDYAVAVYYIIAPAEASSNLARYDGVKYGYRADGYSGLIDMYEKTRSQGFGSEVKRRIMLGTYALSSGFYDAYYKKAQQVRTLIRNELLQKFDDIDVIITPTTLSPAFKIGEKIDDPLEMYLNDIFTISVNLAGICAVSIPCGFSKDNLPYGLQIIGSAFNEQKIFNASYFFQNNTNYHLKIPDIVSKTNI